MIIVTAKSNSSDTYFNFKFEGKLSYEEIQARINNYSKKIFGSIEYDKYYSRIYIIDIEDLDDIPELLEYEPLYDVNEECDC